MTARRSTGAEYAGLSLSGPFHHDPVEPWAPADEFQMLTRRAEVSPLWQ